MEWTGAGEAGTRSYTSYSRDHTLAADGRPDIAGSSDPAFRGDPSRWNPEQLFVASLSACHKLWYLHLCAAAGVTVVAYLDWAAGEMEEAEDGSGRFTSVTLRPLVTVEAGADMEKAQALHDEAARMCFLARSVDFPVRHAPVIRGP